MFCKDAVKDLKKNEQFKPVFKEFYYTAIQGEQVFINLEGLNKFINSFLTIPQKNKNP